MSEVTVVARAKVLPGHEEEMERALRENADASLCEGGCLSYSVLRGDGGAFMTIEHWSSSGDFDQHMKTPHVVHLLQTITPWLAAPPEISTFREI